MLELSNKCGLTNGRYEYVRAFEQPDMLLSNTWIVVRIDGRGFSKYVDLLGSMFVFALRMQVPVELSESFTDHSCSAEPR